MPIRSSREILFALLLPLIFSFQAFAQTDRNTKKRLKIGVVLSGGGARGIAHIGVLKWFEEHRIPVDYLAGTSMGGLVGGMYSTGMSPDEMREFLEKIDWRQTFSGGPPFDQLSFRRKEDQRAFQIDAELGLRKGVSLPTGLSSDHYIGLLIDRITLAYSTLTSFDDLPIPYRCMATDFLAAKPLVLKDGLLSSAMRATMSIPGLFPPVERDGKVLVDGGLLNNIPTNVIREMNPDVVIAVDVGTQLGDVNSIASLFGIVQQSVTVMTIDNDRRNLRLADIIVAPELGDMSLLDFSAIGKVVDIGHQAAAQKAAILEKFSLDEAAWEQYLFERRSRQRDSIPAPDALQVEGVDANSQQIIAQQLQGYIGEPLDIKRLEADLTRALGDGRYAGLGYRFARANPNENVLLITVKEKLHAPPTVNLGVEIDGSDISDFTFTVGSRVTLYDVGRYGSELRIDVKLGFRSIIGSEYFLPLGKKGFFVAPRGVYNRNNESFFVNGSRFIDFITNRIALGGDVGYLKRRSEFRIGYEIGYLDSKVRAGIKVPASVDGRVDFARVRWAFDNQDNATIPTRGALLSAEGRYYFNSPGSNTAFPLLDLGALIFKPISDRASIFGLGLFGTTFNKDAGITEKFTLGGPFRLGAFDRDEFRGNHRFLASIGYQRKIYELPPLLGGKVFAIASYNVGGAYDDFRSPEYNHEGSVGFIIDTRFGPFTLFGNYGEGGRGKVFFTFGRFF